MALTTWEDFVPLVNVHITMVPMPVLKDSILRACTKFCEQTLIYRETLDPVAAYAGTASYDLDAPRQTRIVRPVAVEYEGRALDPIGEDSLPANWQSTAASIPRCYMILAPGIITLYPTPDEDSSEGILVRVALKPSVVAEGIDSRIFDEYGQTIASGALARLYFMPGKPWTNPQMAAFFESEFQTGLTATKIESWKSSTRATGAVFNRPLV